MDHGGRNEKNPGDGGDAGNSRARGAEDCLLANIETQKRTLFFERPRESPRLGKFKDRALPFVTVYPTFYEEFNMSVRGDPLPRWDNNRGCLGAGERVQK